MAYITFLDMLGTRGFCDNPDIYYNNINRFNKAVIQTASLLIDYGKVGIFSDSVYACSNSLQNLLEFLVALRDRLMAEGLFFNAVIKKGDLDFESIAPKQNNVYGVSFKNSGIADLYIAQTNFKGVGIFVDETICDKEIEDSGYEVTHCVYMGRIIQGGARTWFPVSYRDISLRESFPEKWKLGMILATFLEVFYASYMKEPAYGAYYISLISNFIHSFGSRLEWDLANNKFTNKPLIFDVVKKMITSEYEFLKELPGIDYLAFMILDVVYSDSSLTESDMIGITRQVFTIKSVREKYLHNLNGIPRALFDESDNGKGSWERLIRYCQKDFAAEFVNKLLSN